MKEKHIKYSLCFLVIFKEVVRFFVEVSLIRWCFELLLCIMYFVGLSSFVKRKTMLKNILYFIYFLHDICAPIYFIAYHLHEDKFLVEGYIYTFSTISSIFLGLFLIVAITKFIMWLINTKNKTDDGSRNTGNDSLP